MSDPCAELQPAIKTALETDAGVAAAFAADLPDQAVRAFDQPPTNRRESYFTIGEADVLPDLAECIDGAETDCTVHFWCVSDPPGVLVAKRIGAAAQAAILAIDTLPSHRVVSAEPVRTSYAMDPVQKTVAHGVIVVRFFTEPL